jgi:hypothetical protein
VTTQEAGSDVTHQEGEERVSERRAALVAEREQAMAKRAVELDARERALQALERRLHEQAESIAAREAALADAQAKAEAEAQQEPEPEPEPEPAAPLPEGEYSDVELDELERLVRANRDEHPELAESWEFTLYHLREYADVDGRLPLTFDAMIDEVFGPLLDR